MKILFIGGSGAISAACVRRLSAHGHEVSVLNRGGKNDRLPAQVERIQADARDESSLRQAVEGRRFDAVADFIAFKPEHVIMSYDIFKVRTNQYIFISSASAYQKPPASDAITESTPLSNPFWQYSRDKIACEDFLVARYRDEGFPVTIIRPSHTYSEWTVPLAIHGAKGAWHVLDRMRQGKPVPVPGDGTTLWTFTHADDFAAAFAGIAGNPHAIGEAFHITGDERVTWNQAYDSIGRALGVQPNLMRLPTWLLDAAGKPFGYDFTGSLWGDKAHCTVFDNTKIKRFVPGWNASIRYDQGVARSISSMLANPQLQTPDPDFDAFCEKLHAEIVHLKSRLPA